MKRSIHVIRRIHWLFIGVVVFVLGLVGCLKLPLGDPETSKMDAQYVGLWMNQEKVDDNSELYAVVPYDSRTYLLSQFIFHKGDAGAIQPRDRSAMKMWLTDIGGNTFMTAEWKDPDVLLKENQDYIVAKIARSGDRLSVRQVNADFVKDANVQTPEALAKLIADHLKDPKLFEDKEVVYEKVGAERGDEMGAILKAFNHPGAPAQ